MKSCHTGVKPGHLIFARGLVSCTYATVFINDLNYLQKNIYKVYHFEKNKKYI